ncbi:hypothetical protein L207DRAFT_128744 [Hyaloscypha variabilis F]|uniref:Uncharacterized protein n=1 Tax=Hyaloscypha variabilis (strain UAMH 11265 / GT02V1 / F) TaxID=1149755 RepID=A0A2J6R8S4_HYAVF|nr:hypothetical protein L207DRAFT_128744 [Hyaloscypha variabilis F]
MQDHFIVEIASSTRIEASEDYKERLQVQPIRRIINTPFLFGQDADNKFPELPPQDDCPSSLIPLHSSLLRKWNDLPPIISKTAIFKPSLEEKSFDKCEGCFWTEKKAGCIESRGLKLCSKHQCAVTEASGTKCATEKQPHRARVLLHVRRVFLGEENSSPSYEYHEYVKNLVNFDRKSPTITKCPVNYPRLRESERIWNYSASHPSLGIEDLHRREEIFRRVEDNNFHYDGLLKGCNEARGNLQLPLSNYHRTAGKLLDRDYVWFVTQTMVSFENLALWAKHLVLTYKVYPGFWGRSCRHYRVRGLSLVCKMLDPGGRALLSSHLQ